MKKVYLALIEKHLGSILKGLEGEEKVAQAKMYKRANNVRVKKILPRVNFLQNFMRF